MEFGNETFITYFILIGFSRNFQICIFLFVVFFFIFLLTVLGNSIFIIIVVVSPKLHTPMYYFICNLSSIDLCYSTCVFPKMLTDLFSERRISVLDCLIQMNIFIYLAGMEGLLLSVMAYDRYIAICLPLYYTTIMNWFLCKSLTFTMMGAIFIMCTLPILFRPLVFCKKRNLNHFACEFLAVLDLACGDLSFYKLHAFIVTCLMILPFILIVVSYICIITSILKIRSSDGRSKAFSTCASHLTVLLIFFGTIMIVYLGQKRKSSSNTKYIALIYGVITPVLNPLIYSLRNNEVKKAYRKLFFTLSVTFPDSRHHPIL